MCDPTFSLAFGVSDWSCACVDAEIGSLSDFIFYYFLYFILLISS